MFVADAIPAGSPSGARCRSCLRARRRYRTTGVPTTTSARAGTPTPTVLPTNGVTFLGARLEGYSVGPTCLKSPMEWQPTKSFAVSLPVTQS